MNRMNLRLKQSVFSILQAKFVSDGTQPFRRYLTTNTQILTSNLKCERQFSSSPSRNSLYLTSCLLQVNVTNTVIPVRFATKKSVPLDPICKQPITHPEKGSLVYVGYLAPQLKHAKGFAIFSSIVAMSLQPMMWQYFVTNHIGSSALAGYSAVMVFFIFGMPIIQHLMAKNYVSHLYYNKDTGIFTATLIGFFSQQKHLVFTANDVQIPISPGMFTHVKVKGKPIYVHQPAFRSKEAYIHMMGYDKPIDLKYDHHKKS